MIEPDLILARIITSFTGLPESRVVLTNQEFTKPTDKAAFVTVQLGDARVIGVSQIFDAGTNKETSSVALQAQAIIEVTSYDESAKRIRHEIIMALTSSAGLRQQEDAQISIYRTADIRDLSGVDGAKSLYRYQIPVKINYVESKETSVNFIDKFLMEELRNE